jgi:hypothetical protein
MRLECSGVWGRGRDREFGKGWLEFQSLSDFVVNIPRGKSRDRPLALSLALSANSCAISQSPAYIDTVLTFAEERISDNVAVVPNAAKEVSTDVLKFFPAFGNRQFR